MKKKLVIAALLYVVFFVLGCRSLSEAVDSYRACRSNEVCYAEMEKGRTLTESLATALAAGVPFPPVQSSAGAIGYGLGMLTSVIIGAFRGRKYKGKGK